MSTLNFNWNSLKDMVNDLQDVSTGKVNRTDAEKLVMRQASMDYFESILDKVLPYDETQALKELEVESIASEIVNHSSSTFSISRKEKYEVDSAAIQAAGFKNQTDMFNSVAGSADTLYEGLFKKKTTIFFDSKKAEKIYKSKSAGSELIKVSESASLTIKKGGK